MPDVAAQLSFVELACARFSNSASDPIFSFGDAAMTRKLSDVVATGCFQRTERCSAISLADTSIAVPGGNGTSIWTVRCGQSWAEAVKDSADAAARPMVRVAIRRFTLCMTPSSGVVGFFRADTKLAPRLAPRLQVRLL